MAPINDKIREDNFIKYGTSSKTSNKSHSLIELVELKVSGAVEHATNSFNLIKKVFKKLNITGINELSLYRFSWGIFHAADHI